MFKKAGLGRHMYYCKGPKAKAKPRALDKALRGFKKCHTCHKFHHYKAIKNCKNVHAQAVGDLLYFSKAVHKEKRMMVEATQGNNIYAVERIVDSRREGRKVEYLVKWAGYSADHNTWEPKVNILDKRLINNFQR